MSGAGRRAHKKGACRRQAPLAESRGYAAFAFTDLVGTFAASFLAALTFYFVANSCLTLGEMTSVSTLYAVAASRSTCAAFCRVAAWRMQTLRSSPLSMPSDTMASVVNLCC